MFFYKIKGKYHWITKSFYSVDKAWDAWKQDYYSKEKITPICSHEHGERYHEVAQDVEWSWLEEGEIWVAHPIEAHLFDGRRIENACRKDWC